MNSHYTSSFKLRRSPRFDSQNNACTDSNSWTSLIPTYGQYFRVESRASGIEAIFPATDITGATEPDVLPDHEKRVFSFDNDSFDDGDDSFDDEALKRGNEPAIIEQDRVGELPAFQRTASQGSAQSLSASQPSLSRTASSSSSLGEGQLPRPASSSSAQSRSPPAGSGFKARPVPISMSMPSITPRLSKAAALRMGIAVPPRPRPFPSNQGAASTSMTEKRVVELPKSLAKPSIEVRPTKASAFRIDGQDLASQARIRPPTTRRQSLNTSERSAGFEGLPGFGGRKAPVRSPSADPVGAT